MGKKKENAKLLSVKVKKDLNKNFLTSNMITALDKEIDVYLRASDSPVFCVNHSIALNASLPELEFQVIKQELLNHYAGFDTTIFLIEEDCTEHLCVKLML